MTSVLCKNPKPDGSWCGVPIEWREIQIMGQMKKRPFEVDTGQQHKCPYWKPTKKVQLKPEDQAVFDKFEQEGNKNPPMQEQKEYPYPKILDKLIIINEKLDVLTAEVKGFFQAWTAENSFKKASEDKK